LSAIDFARAANYRLVMHLVRLGLSLGLAGIAVLVLTAPVGARGVRCEDIARELARGKSASEVAQALDTTRTRIAACAQLAVDRERHEDRQARIRARQANRLAGE
jgi:hypothetical protein